MQEEEQQQQQDRDSHGVASASSIGTRLGGARWMKIDDDRASPVGGDEEIR